MRTLSKVEGGRKNEEPRFSSTRDGRTSEIFTRLERRFHRRELPPDSRGLNSSRKVETLNDVLPTWGHVPSLLPPYTSQQEVGRVSLSVARSVPETLVNFGD